MAHEVETMFSARLLPWHELGFVTSRELTAAEALRAGQIGWGVEKRPLFVQTKDGLLPVESHVATVRDSDQSILGVVGAGYEPIQNERMLTWAELLVDTGEAQFTTAGSLREGRIVFACLEINREIHLPGGDELVPYFVVATSHDGSHAMKAFTSTTRVVCKNTLDASERAQRSSFYIKHTANAEWKLETARRMLGVVMGYYDEFTERATAMIQQTVTDEAFKKMVRTIMPEPEDATPRQRELVFASRGAVHNLYRGETIGQFKGTGWGAFNSVNEYELWGKRIKGSRAERHALRALDRDFPLTVKAEKYLAGLN